MTGWTKLCGALFNQINSRQSFVNLKVSLTVPNKLRLGFSPNSHKIPNLCDPRLVKNQQYISMG